MSLHRRRLLQGAAFAAVAGTLAGCGASPTTTTSGEPTPTATGSSPATTPTPTPSGTSEATTSPDPAVLRRKIGGMLLVGFRGLTLAADAPVLRAITDDGLAGVILFDRDLLTGKARNIESPDQLAELTATLRAADGRPLLVAVDQEGGRVARLKPSNGFPATVSEAKLGLEGVDAATAAGRATATTLREVGIDWNLAPVVDLDVNPENPSIGALDRSFSADPAVVAELATAVIAAHRDAGVLTSLKHFPGLGSATRDTDREFVDISRTWTPRELQPFRDLISAGTADTVMVANAVNRQLDPDLPASLSERTVTGTLRGDLGWDGLVVTDDLQAGAIRDSYPDATAIELALTAGADVLLFANQQVYVADIAQRTIDTIVDLVRRGRVTEARIDASLARIADARARIAR